MLRMRGRGPGAFGIPPLKTFEYFGPQRPLGGSSGTFRGVPIADPVSDHFGIPFCDPGGVWKAHRGGPKASWGARCIADEKLYLWRCFDLNWSLYPEVILRELFRFELVNIPAPRRPIGGSLGYLCRCTTFGPVLKHFGTQFCNTSGVQEAGPRRPGKKHCESPKRPL